MKNGKYVSRDASEEQRIELLFQKMQDKLGDKDYFTLGDVTHDKMLGHKLVETLKPIFEHFLKEGLVEVAEKEGRYRFPQQEPEGNSREEVEPNRFVITTAVEEKDVNKPFLEAIKNYLNRNNAELLIIPCKGRGIPGKKKEEDEDLLPQLSEDLSSFQMILKDTYLNDNICIAAIDIPAVRINPLSSIDRVLAKMDASIILPSPKIFLKHVPNMHSEIPPAVMTTGAITVNSYGSKNGLMKKSDYLAELDHTYGAVVVEIENDKIFHFRHILASEDGSFIDLGIEYLPDGSIRKVTETAMVMGDSHIGYHDMELHQEAIGLAHEANVREIVLHDVFHGASISHHDVGKSITNAIKAREGKLGLERECMAVKNYISSMVNQGFDITIVKSNHDGHLFRYLNEARYVTDPINNEFSLKLALAATKDKDPLQYAIEEELHYKNSKVKWLQEDVGYRIYGVEVSHHGSKGANGSRGSLTTFEKGLGNCVTAHTHSAAITRDAYCVGTVGLMDMGYNKGLSSWTRTCCLIYNNGMKQLINFIPDGCGNYSYKA